jgi:hypothetical protein
VFLNSLVPMESKNSASKKQFQKENTTLKENAVMGDANKKTIPLNQYILKIVEERCIAAGRRLSARRCDGKQETSGNIMGYQCGPRKRGRKIHDTSLK